MCSSDIFLGLLAILFPPLPVWVKRGICSSDSLINILLCCLGFLPGLLHSWYIIAKFPDEDEYQPLGQGRQDAESGRVVYVHTVGGERRQPKVQPRMNNNANYGTAAPTQADAVQQQVNGTWQGADNGEGSAAPPPSYNQAVGDHKIQTHD